MRKALSFAIVFLLMLPSCGKKSTDPENGGADISGYWEFFLTNQGEEDGPVLMLISQSESSISISSYGEKVTAIGTFAESTISFSFTVEDAEREMTFTGSLGKNNISGNWSDSFSSSGTWRGTKLEGDPDFHYYVIQSIDVFCSRFENGQYWVQGTITDPDHLIEDAYMSGSYIDGICSLAYNLYEDEIGEWWTNPNIFVSNDTPPEFPLNYTVHISLKNGRSEDVSKIVTNWH